jgi:hypothetical protein
MEWEDWKRDVEMVFERDPQTYQARGKKVLKALDYLDPSLKSLWYSYSDQKEGTTQRWSSFLGWTRDNIQNDQYATVTLYERFESAKQLPNQSPAQFNADLSAIERHLPRKDEKYSTMIFYSKLTQELKRQFNMSNIAIPETRTQCAAVAQRVWEGLHGCKAMQSTQTYRDKGKDSRSYRDQARSSSKYHKSDSRRDRKDRYHTSHRKNER